MMVRKLRGAGFDFVNEGYVPLPCAPLHRGIELGLQNPPSLIHHRMFDMFRRPDPRCPDRRLNPDEAPLQKPAPHPLRHAAGDTDDPVGDSPFLSGANSPSKLKTLFSALSRMLQVLM